MVWIGITEFGTTEPYFVKKGWFKILTIPKIKIFNFLLLQNTKGETIDSVYYHRRILPYAKRKGNQLFGGTKWLFQQDGATPHTANICQNYCEKNLFKFIKKDKWPPNSPDLNPCDYYFWNAVVTRMNCSKFSGIDTFKEEIKRAINNIPIEEIKKAVNSFTSRVSKLEESKGDHCHF